MTTMVPLTPPPGTVCCLLCRGMVTYRNLDTSRFMAHMNYEHGAYFDMEFLLAACLMDEEERKAVRNVMELKHRAQQEKGKEVEDRRRGGGGEEERRGEKRVQGDQGRSEPPPQPVAVKEEVAEEVRVLPEQYDGPTARPSFPCTMCDKTFLLQKYLQAHQAKTCHTNTPTPALPAPKEPEFKCGQCSYSGSRAQDLRLHVSKKHGTEPARPSTPALTTPAPSSPPTSSVKKEPSDSSPSLAELSVSAAVTAEDPDDPPPPADEAMVPAPQKVEATTFVAIQTEGHPAPKTDKGPVVQVDISKSKYFKANPQTVQTDVEGKAKEQYDTMDDKLPTGWKVKEIQHEFKSGRKETKRHYLTPDCKALKTGLAVLEYMRLSGKYSAKEIMDYAKYLAVPVNRLEKYMELYL